MTEQARTQTAVPVCRRDHLSRMIAPGAAGWANTPRRVFLNRIAAACGQRACGTGGWVGLFSCKTRPSAALSTAVLP